MKVDRRLDVQAASSRFSCLLHEEDRRQTQPSPTQQITTPTSRFSVPPFLSRPMADSTLRFSFSPDRFTLPFLCSLASKPDCSSIRSRLDTRRFSVAFPAFLSARSSRKQTQPSRVQPIGATLALTVSPPFPGARSPQSPLAPPFSFTSFYRPLPLSAHWAESIVRREEGRRRRASPSTTNVPTMNSLLHLPTHMCRPFTEQPG